ncbi:MAG: Nif3-like dinuclear metal center hexameric protein [Bacteroidales bacterium]|jgi:dinuclear metal center YbgI/SA1388 family protein
MKLKELCSFLDSAIPLSFQESYDNSGLQVGNPEQEISSALLTTDITEEVVEEAMNNGCELIISHHPLIFKNLKSITGKTITETIILKSVQQNIAIYSSHTNLDAVQNGVSMKMAEKLGLRNVRVLLPLRDKLLKLVTFVPEAHFEKVAGAIFDAGAGVTGNYDRCGFSAAGRGSFRAGNNARPFTGEKGIVHFENEIRFETVLFSHLKNKVIAALIKNHPYEEVAYDIIKLDNEIPGAGMGCVGDLIEPAGQLDFIKRIADIFNAQGIRHSSTSDRMISKVALCGGSGAFLLNDAISHGADAFVTGDVKYHDWFDADKRILLVDIGHYESEKFSTEILYEIIIKKFPKFALRFSKVNTNPIKYFR